MNQTIITYIVTYVDPGRPYEGNQKTRHFPTLEQAQDFVKMLPPETHSIKIVRQETTTTRIVIQ